MGQYYNIIFLSEKQDGRTETIRAWFTPTFRKLMEHSYLDEDFLQFIEFLLSRGGLFYRTRIVWAGDYADPDEHYEKVLTKEEALKILEMDSDAEDELEPTPNLYQMCQDDNCGFMLQRALMEVMQSKIGKKLNSFLVNHTKKQFVHMRKDGQPNDGIHPLPLLVSEGNGRGGGDYIGRHQELCGTWSRDVISVEESIPEDYTELVCDFFEEDFEE